MNENKIYITVFENIIILIINAALIIIFNTFGLKNLHYNVPNHLKKCKEIYINSFLYLSNWYRLSSPFFDTDYVYNFKSERDLENYSKGNRIFLYHFLKTF